MTNSTRIATPDSLTRLTAAAVDAFEARRNALLADAARRMMERDDIAALSGDAPARALLDSHRQHAALLRSTLAGGDADLLARVLPWAYRALHAKGLSYDFLGEQLACWQQTVQQQMVAEHAAPILSLYTWLRAIHPQVAAAAEKLPAPRRSDSTTDGARAKLFAGLLEGRADRCLAVGEQFTATAADLTTFLTHVVQPTIVDVGKLAEHGQLTAARERRAANILSQTLSVLYTRVVVPDGRVGLAIVATAVRDARDRPDWMMATFLEADGWRVTCVDGGSPADTLSMTVRDLRPHLLTIPMTGPHEVAAVAKAIKSVRSHNKARAPQILVGGMGMHVPQGDLDSLGADAISTDYQDAVLTARRLLNIAA
ncbi:MAG: hypothetical protein AMXMBFR64_00850 [Myxococcales bacterium]